MKIVNLGLPMTGTRCLHDTLKKLNYVSTPFSEDLSSFKYYDAVCETDFSVTQISKLYEFLNEDVYWVLTTRCNDTWEEAVQKAQHKIKPYWHKFWWRNENWAQSYKLYHEFSIKQYLYKEKQRLLVLPFEYTDKWHMLKKYLGKVEV